MSEVQGIDLSASKRMGQTGGRPRARAPMWRLLLVCLAVLTGAMLVTACDVAKAPDVELDNGFGPYGIAHMVVGEHLGNGYGPYGIVHMHAYEQVGNGYGPYGIAHLAVSQVGTGEEAINGAGSYGVFRLAAGEPRGGNRGSTDWNSAGSYGALRLSASKGGAAATSDLGTVDSSAVAEWGGFW